MGRAVGMWLVAHQALVANDVQLGQDAVHCPSYVVVTDHHRLRRASGATKTQRGYQQQSSNKAANIAVVAGAVVIVRDGS